MIKMKWSFNFVHGSYKPMIGISALFRVQTVGEYITKGGK